jgi:hypothetical protein
MAWPDCLHYTLRKRTAKTVMRRENSRREWIEILFRCGESFRFPRLRLATSRQLSGASGAGKGALEANFGVTRSWLRFRWVSQVSQFANLGHQRRTPLPGSTARTRRPERCGDWDPESHDRSFLIRC